MNDFVSSTKILLSFTPSFNSLVLALQLFPNANVPQLITVCVSPIGFIILLVIMLFPVAVAPLYAYSCVMLLDGDSVPR